MSNQWLSLIQVKLSGSGNFQSWRNQMEDLFMIQQLSDFIDGTRPRPIAAIANAPTAAEIRAIHEWVAKDKQVQAYIRISVDENVRHNIASLASAEECWNKLHDIYMRKDQARIIHVKRELLGLPYLGSVAAHINQVKNLRQQLISLGATVDDLEIVHSIIASLPESFHTFVSMQNELNTLGTMSLDTLESKLLSEERLITCSAGTSTSSPAFTAAHKGKGKASTSGQQQFQSVTRQMGHMTLGSSTGQRQIICHYCQLPGHKAPDCQKKLAEQLQNRQGNQGQRHQNRFNPQNRPPAQRGGRGNPRGGRGRGNAQYRPRNQQRNQGNAATWEHNELGDTDFANMAEETPSTRHAEWLVDSGATAHMTGEAELLTDTQPVVQQKNKTVVFGDAGKLQMTQVGQCPIFQTASADYKYLKNVFLVPGMSRNLLSVSKLNNQMLDVFFSHTGICEISDIQGTVVATGHQKDGLYILDSEMAVSLAATHTDDAVGKGKEIEVPDVPASQKLSKDLLWHLRLGHVNMHALQLMFKCNMVLGLPKINQRKCICEACLKRKM